MAGSLHDQVFVAFDTETTGLGVSARLVEIGAVRFAGTVVLATFQRLVAPGVPVTPGARAVHGLSDADVAGQPPAEIVLPAFFAFVGDAPLLAHNAPFDLGVLGRECSRLGLAPPANPVFDTRDLAQTLGLSRNGSSLAALLRALGLPTRNLHRALPDAQAARLLFRASLTQAPRLGTLDDLVALVGLPRTLAHTVASVPVLPATLRWLEKRLGLPVLIRYAGGSKGDQPRPITPQAFFAEGEYVYMEAHCHLDGVVKVFRADRVLSAEPLEP